MRHGSGVVEKVHPDQGGDLIVAAAAGSELAPEVGADFDDVEGSLECAVHILVAGLRNEGPVLDGDGEAVEARVHPGFFVGGEISGGGERLRMGVGAGEVVERERPVEVRGSAQFNEFGRRPRGEPAAPVPPAFVPSPLVSLTAPA